MLSPSDNPFTIRITNGAQEIPCVLVKDRQGRPVWQRGAASPLSPSINTSLVTNMTTPPDQGLQHTIEGTEGGAGAYYNSPGRYSFAENMHTRGHRPMPGPECLATALMGGGALNGVIADQCEHNSTTYIAAGTKVYYLDYTNSLWIKTATDPVGNVKITKIQSYHGLLIAWMDNAPADFPGAGGKPYEYSEDNGATWHVASGTGRVSGKYSAIKEIRSQRPVLQMVADPNITYDTEDPRDAGNWSRGIQVGDNQGYDHFTSVIAAPSGEILFGKEVGWRVMDAFENIDPLIHLQPDSGLGTENFAWPVIMGGRVYAVGKDYDLIEYSERGVRTGLGPKFLGPDIPEMQKPISALATDEVDTLYVALAGAEGYVMEWVYDSDKGRYYGALINLGQEIARMWTASYALATNKNMWLWIAPAAAPYLPYRALIPRGDYETDTDARYLGIAKIRFGWVDAGQSQITKILAQCLLITKNLLAGSRTVELQYRVDGASAWTSLNTFSVSPQPTTLSDTYFPAGTSCKRFEIMAIITNAPNTEVCSIESIVTTVYRRPLRLDTLSFTVMAETGMATRMGGDALVSAQGLMDFLWNARNAVVPPTITRDWDGLVWTVDIKDIEETWVQESDGAVPALAYRVTCQELPTITSIAQSGGGAAHTHITDTFVGDATVDFTLTHTPVGPAIVHVAGVYQFLTTDYSISGTTITFVSAPAVGVAVAVEYPY